MTVPSDRQPAGSSNTGPFNLVFDPKICRHAAAVGHRSLVNAACASEARRANTVAA